MLYAHSTLALTVKSATLFDAGDLVGFDDARITLADAPVKGVALHPCTEIGQDLTVIAIGTAQAKAAGAITAGQRLVSAAGGGVQPAGSSPANVIGRALIDAIAGQRVTLLLRSPGVVFPAAAVAFSSSVPGPIAMAITVPSGGTLNARSATWTPVGGSPAAAALGGTLAAPTYTAGGAGTLTLTVAWTDATGTARVTVVGQSVVAEEVALTGAISPAAPVVGATITITFNASPDAISATQGGTPLAVSGSGTTRTVTASAQGAITFLATKAGYTGWSGGVTVSAAAYGPIPGILTAPQVLISGASLEAWSWYPPGISGGATSKIAQYAALIGYTGTVSIAATAGHEISGTRGHVASQKADATVATTQGANLYLSGGGGNNISNSRPYPGNASGIASQLNLLVADLQTGGDRAIIWPMSYRNYTGEPTVAASEANGSKPYNDAIWSPKIATTCPEFDLLDTYGFTKEHSYFLQADGIHFNQTDGGVWLRYILASVMGRALGIPRTRSLSGRSFVYLFKPVTGSVGYLPGRDGTNYNVTETLGGTLSRVQAVAAKAWGSSYIDPYIMLTSLGLMRATASGSISGANPRVADARLSTADAMAANISFVTGGQVPSLDLRLEQLGAGASVTLTFAGGRTETDGNRAGRITVTGGGAPVSGVLDTAANATSNQLSLTTTADAMGMVTINVTPEGAGTACSLSAIAVDVL